MTKYNGPIIQPKTIYPSTNLRGINPTNYLVISWSLVLRSIALGWVLIIVSWAYQKISIFRHFRIKSYSDSGVKNSHKIFSTKIEVGTLWEYSIVDQKCEAILNNVLLLLWTNSLSLQHAIKTSTYRHDCSKNFIPGSQKYTNNQYILYPQNKLIIETSREYFSISIFGRKHQSFHISSW